EGVVGDTACASHLTQPSRWAPHDLGIVAKHVLGRALPDDEAILGTSKGRKAWSKISVGRVAEHAAQHADAIAAIWQKLSPELDPKLFAEYRVIGDICVRMELTGIIV